MSPTTKKINSNSTVSEIVSQHYRTADVFHKYGIDFCCGGKLPLKMVCEMRDLNLNEMEKELETSIRTINISASLKFEQWNIDFLTEYLVNIHHEFLKNTLPSTEELLDRFVDGHKNKFPYLIELQKVFHGMAAELIPHLREEEEVIFPYIRYIAHAYNDKETYASLFVRTLKKPVENIMMHEHDIMKKTLSHIRTLTDHYTPPSDACVNHKVTFQKLAEIDNDLAHHMHLENDILFPKAITMEKELLQKKD